MENPPPPRKDLRDPETSKPMVGPRNMAVVPMKQGKPGTKPGTAFDSKIPYMGDDYDIKKKILAKERDYHLSKL